MNSKYEASITRVKKLYEGFYDVIHDWEHSERVAANSHLIANNIGYHDKEFLELGALWHDTARTRGIIDGHKEEGALMAKKDLEQHGVDKETAERVYTAIRFHKSSSSPTSIEGRIIRDADMLDLFMVARWKKCNDAGWTREYADNIRKTFASYKKYFDAFTYDFTKEQFRLRLPSFLRYYESVKDHLPE